MININSFRDFVLYVARKSGKGTMPTPEQFNSFTNAALREYVMKRYSNRAEYQAGRPIPRVSYELTQAVIDDLRHLKESRDMIVANGRIPVPNGTTVRDKNNSICPDYLHVTALRGSFSTSKNGVITTTQVPIQVISDDEWATLLSNPLVAPTTKYPIANMQNTYFSIAPPAFQYINITYLRQPFTANWGYTTANNRPVYDPATSTDVDAPMESFNEIAMNVLSFLGISIREGELTQYAEAKANAGV